MIDRWNANQSIEKDFWSIISESGRVIALRVTREEYARQICDEHNRHISHKAARKARAKAKR